MPNKIKRPCSKPGCYNLTTKRFCEICKSRELKIEQREYDRQRGSAAKRGYDSRWRHAAKAFLAQPGNEFCKLQLTGCTGLADTVDHIDPVDGPNDPKFWDRSNWQASCVHCNRLKGKRYLKGERL